MHGPHGPAVDLTRFRARTVGYVRLVQIGPGFGAQMVGTVSQMHIGAPAPMSGVGFVRLAQIAAREAAR